MAYVKRQHEEAQASTLMLNSIKSQNEAMPKIQSEAELCEIFIRDFNLLEGWLCYPEACGFDVLAVHDDGRQIGIEAKMTVNAKVADQILPSRSADYFGLPGPDYRLVIVSKITDAGAGIVKMLERQGVRVIVPQVSRTANGHEFSFSTSSMFPEAIGKVPTYGDQYLFDWNPAERCRVPSHVNTNPAGVRSPVQLTPWKESALKILSLMRSQGFITAKQIAHHGHGVSRWTQHNGGKHSWLVKGAVRGQWVECEHMPAFDLQHPDAYRSAVEALAREARMEFQLTD